jgi:hypothetical protein
MMLDEKKDAAERPLRNSPGDVDVNDRELHPSRLRII